MHAIRNVDISLPENVSCFGNDENTCTASFYTSSFDSPMSLRMETIFLEVWEQSQKNDIYISDGISAQIMHFDPIF